MTPYASSLLRSSARSMLTSWRRRSHLASHGSLTSHQMTAHRGAPPAKESLATTTSLPKKLKPQSTRSHSNRRPSLPSPKPQLLFGRRQDGSRFFRHRHRYVTTLALAVDDLEGDVLRS